jgi:hypothetical protein
VLIYTILDVCCVCDAGLWKEGAVENIKKRRNVYMGQEYLDLEAIAVNERKRSGRDIRVSDLIRRACREYKENYWRDIVRETDKNGRDFDK